MPYISSAQIKKDLCRSWPGFIKERYIKNVVNRLYYEKVTLKLAIDELADVDNFVHNVALLEFMRLEGVYNEPISKKNTEA